MATKKVLIQVILNDKASKQIKKTGDEVQKLSSKVTILNKEQKQQIINDEKSAIQKKNLINELKAQAAAEMNVVAAQKQGRAQSGLNNAILLETGRLASDASYGFTAIANNLSQVVTLFSSFAETNGGVVASMKELGKSLWGMGGILIGIQLLISFGPKILDFFTGMDEAAKKAAKSQKELADSLNDLNANIVVSEEYIKVIEDVNTTEEERENIIKELIKLIPDLKQEDFKYGDNLDKVKEKINEYAIAQASRIEIDKLVQDNSELLGKRRKINLINEIEDDEERLKAIKQFAKEEGFTQKLQQQQFGVYNDLTEKDNKEYINIFKSRSKAVIGESDTILDKIRELTDTSFLGGKGDDGKALQDKYDKEFEELNKFLTKQEALEQIYFDSKLTDEQIEINKVRDKYFKFIDMAKAFGFDTSLLEKARQSEIDAIKKKFSDKELEEEEKKQQQLQKIRDKYQLGKLKIEEDTLDDPETQDELAVFEEKQLARVAKEEELAILALDKLKLSTEDKEKAVTDIEEYYAAVRLKNKKENQETSEKIDNLETKSKLEALDKIGKGLMAASNIAGKATGVGKALAVAGTLMSTYSAAQKAYESQMQLDPTSPIRANIARAAAILSGLANVRAILSVKSPAMKETSAVTGGQGNVQVQAPDFNVVGQGGVNQLGQVIGAQFGQPIRAYVVSGDISSAQELDRSITAGATID
tara:strand:+ start:520 stop:2634 length:2115 start_codon:yes stop_codon:yes gene_type:complete